MKKFFIFSSALIITVLASCNKEQTEVPVDINENDNIIATGVFSFPAIREVPTKSYLGEDNNFVWENGESIAVVYGTTVKEFKYNESSNLFSCEGFEESATGPFYVVSPFRSDLTIEDGKVVSELPATQTAGNHGVDSNALVSVGQAASVEDLKAGVSLKNAFSLIKVTLTDSDVSSISFEGNADGLDISPVLAGPVKVSTEGVATVSGRKTAVTLKASSGNLAAGSYYLAVVPQTLSKGLKVVFKREGEDQAYYRKASSKSYELKANEGIDLGSFTLASISNRCWYIQDASDLNTWRAATMNDSDIIFLADDIDMEGTSHSPFDMRGSFDGQNHCIARFKSEMSGANSGFFYYNYGPVKNTVFGSLDGNSYDEVSIISVDGLPDTQDNWMYSGIIARAQADVSGIRNYVPIKALKTCKGKVRAGGITGLVNKEGIKISNCINYATISSEASDKTVSDSKDRFEALFGGIAACCDPGAGKIAYIENCANYGTVSTSDPFTTAAAGIIGNTPSTRLVEVRGCHNYAAINISYDTTLPTYGTSNTTQESYVGGIGGYINGGNTSGTLFDDCHNHANLKPTGRAVAGVGGIIGRAHTTTVSNCVNDGTVSYTRNVKNRFIMVGGIVGAIYYGGNIIKCINNKAVLSQRNQVNRVGGIVGTVNSGIINITQCVNNGTVAITRSAANENWQAVGGIVGFQEASTTAVIDGCTNNNKVSISMENNTTHQNEVTAGGIIGLAHLNVELKNNSNSSEVSITNSGSSDSYAGGIAGWLRSTSSTGDTNTGSISATSGSGTACAGALVGNNAGTFTNAKVKGSVNGTVLTASNFNDYLYGTNTGTVSGTIFITE
ncbi:MAG: hypothetical protein IJP93_09860 [Bacteroidales bacterium]|nr:hypothetical protein [Bacteroidales bacterium]MBR0084376.1 hypothetical protein [Bacteroidales bacterium]